MRTRSNLAEGEEAEVMMAPLIDCVFLLIIFFLVTSVMKKIEKELPMDLPDSAAAIKTPKESDLFIIGVDRAGQIHVHGEQVSLDTLHTKLREIAQQKEPRRIRIDGDRMTPFQNIVYVLDLCQFEGLKNIGVHTSDESGTPMR